MLLFNTTLFITGLINVNRDVPSEVLQAVEENLQSKTETHRSKSRCKSHHTGESNSFLHNARNKMKASSATRYLISSGILLLFGAIRADKWPTKCPEKCLCYIQSSENGKQRKKEVDCRNSSLALIPSDVPLDAEVLLLSNNSLTSIASLPSLATLQYLDVSHNDITSIGSYFIFQHLYSLRTLRLNSNMMTSLSHGSFSGLKFLDVLDLSDNAIIDITDYAFGGLNHLHTLYLDRNRMTQISNDWLEGMPFLHELHMVQNRLMAITNNTLQAVGELNTLNLASNRISAIALDCFRRLDKLQVINLAYNKLDAIPSAVIRQAINLKILVLDGNPIERLHSDDFLDMNITELSVSFMPDLVLLEKHALCRLPNLIILQLHDNNKMLFIHSEAFQDVPNLSILYLHNNNLKALSVVVQESLPSLTEIHLYHNPLQCDCNAYWIKYDLMRGEFSNNSESIFSEANLLICNTPLNTTKVPLMQIPLQLLHAVCAPMNIAFFNDSYSILLGKELRLECHAIGMPTPKITWMLPGGHMINESYTDSAGKIHITENNVLHVKSVKLTDEGTYACFATNIVGSDASSTIVHVNINKITLHPRGVSYNYITLAWSSPVILDPTVDVSILHKEQDSKGAYKSLHLMQHRHTYTFLSLKPVTTYEFCPLYANTEFFPLDCINVTTAHESDIPKGIRKIVDANVFIGILSTIGGVVFFGCLAAIIRKFRRKEYQQPGCDSHDIKGDNSAQIPLENLYNPPNTPICTSRTSLIPHSQV